MTHRDKHLAEGFFTLKAKPGAGMCMVKGCRKNLVAGKAGLCHAHHQQRWRLRSPKRSAYSTLRDHAIARGLAFTISYDYYCGMLDAVAYWDHSAETRGEVLSLDRIKSWEGYVPGNLRVVTISLNSEKSNRERFLPEHVQSILDRKRERAKAHPCLTDERIEDERCPF